MSRHVCLAACFLACSIFVAGCGSSERTDRTTPLSNSSGSTESNVQSRTQVAVQLNWYPEAEHGGLYQAAADGTFDASGFQVDLRPGGRATPVGAELELGRVQFAMANADDVVAFRRQGMDIVAVLAVMQDSPRCILVRQDSGVTKLEELGGMTLQRQAGRPFLEFMRSRGILDQVSEVPYHGSVSSMIADPKIAIQAYSFAEPLLARQQGIEVRTLMVSDLGWNPYSSVLVTSGELIRSEPELVRNFVLATRKGWQNYLTDASKGNEAILAANRHGMTAEALDFGSQELRPLAIPEPMSLQDVGKMTALRWEELVQEMDKLDPKGAGKVNPADCFTTQFLD